MEQRDVDHLIELAAQNICNGVIEEPRVFFDVIPLLAGGLISTGDPSTFINGEQFPVRITEALFALRPDFGGNVGLDERALQDVGVRFVFHDAYYQTAAFVPAPTWATKVTTGPVMLSPGLIAYVFDRPVVLSARDTLRVTVALEAATAQDTFRRVDVAFYGTGIQSKRPYHISSSRNLTTTVPVVLSGADFRNDGAEPIALTDMTVELSAQSDDAVGAGDVRRVRVQVEQIGNGTGARWFVGPTVPTPLSQCPAHMLGFTQGRSVVHRIPLEGLLWEPGEGINVEAVALRAAAEGKQFGISLRGYISLV